MIDFEKTRLAIKFRNTFTDPPFLLKVREYENVRGKKVFWMTTIAIILMGLILQLLVAGILNKPRSGLFSSDIYYIWIEGVKLANHQNPYARILNGSKEVNAKYPTYLPFNYLFVAALVELGYGSFTDWIFIFRLFSMVFFFLITFNLFFIFYKKSYSLSLFAVLFWMFNRWTLYILFSVDVDFAPLFFLILSLQQFEDHPNFSFYLFGISIFMKHMGIILIPLYLIMVTQKSNGAITRIQNLFSKDMITAGIKMAIIPFIFSLPFFIWSPMGFVDSIAFSLTRLPDTSFKASSFDAYLSPNRMALVGVLLKLPIVLMILVVLIVVNRGHISMKIGAFLIMSVFIDFNAVLFDQYLVWNVPLMLIALHDFLEMMRMKIIT